MKAIKTKKLNKYDQFYRVVGEPLISMQIDDFVDDLHEFIFKTEKEYEQLHKNKIFNLDQLPYVKFLEHFKEKPEWKAVINNVDSPFMRLMQIDNLFFKK